MRHISSATAATLILAAVLVSFPLTSLAQDKLTPPPYVVSGTNHVLVGVVLDEAAVRRMLPPGVNPTKDMTGGINIYQAERANSIGAYHAAYIWADVDGYDSPDGAKGRFILVAVGGPDQKVSASLQGFYGLPARVGTSRIEPTPDGKLAIGSFNGQDVIATEVKSHPDACSPAGGMVNYLSVSPVTHQVLVNPMPWVGDFCHADPVAVKVMAQPSDPFAQKSRSSSRFGRPNCTMARSLSLWSRR